MQDTAVISYPVGSKEFLRLLRLAETGLRGDWHSPELDALCNEAREHFSVASAAVTILDKDFQYIRARAGIEASRTPRCLAFCNYTIVAQDVFVVEDAKNARSSAATRWSQETLSCGFMPVRRWCSAET